MRRTTRTTRSTETASLRSFALVGAGVLSSAALLLTGCATSSSTAAVKVPVAAAAHSVGGKVFGGQQPVSGSTIQLYAMGTSGNASAASPLLTSAVTTDANGAFNITAMYTCPTNAQVYITATGGNPQVGGSSTDNAAIALMADLGDCATLQLNAATTYVSINEVTTVAAVYALGSFISDYANVGYASGNLQGASNAYTTQNSLVNLASGSAPGKAATGVTVPSARVNTLADAIASCINSSGPTSPTCSALFSETGVGTGHQNTVAVLAALAHSPATNAAAIYSNVPATPPFQPTLTTTPNDWTIPIVFKGGGLTAPSGLAVDASGGVWIANQGGNAITKISSESFASGTGGYTSTALAGPSAVAIDSTGNIWVANTGADDVVELSSLTGAIVNTVTANLATPNALAFDGLGNLWVTNFAGNSVSKFDANGNAQGSPFTGVSLIAPAGVAVDSSNTVWVSSSFSGTLNTFTTAGANTGSYTDGLILAPGGVATDSLHSRIWTAATGINAVAALTGAGAAVAGEPYGTGVSLPLAVAVDGNGTVWTANSVSAGTLSGFTYSGAAVTPVTGLGSLNQPASLAIDASGNIWVSSMGDNSVTQFVGLATAATTPLVTSAR